MNRRSLLDHHDDRLALLLCDAAGSTSLRRGELRALAADFEARVRPAFARAAAEKRPVGLLAATALPTIVALAALLESDTPVLLLHPADPEPRRRALLERTGAVALIDSDGTLVELPRTESPLPSLPDPASVILATSGSSGLPKLVLHSRKSLEASVTLHRGNLPWKSEGDRYLLQLPFAHVGGFGILFRGFVDAQTTVTLSHTRPGEPDFGLALADAGVTLLSLVPTQLRRLLDAETRLPGSVRAILVGGASLPESDRAKAARLGYPLLATYGLTEFGSQVATERPAGEPGGVGYPLGDNEVRLGPRERIEIRGPSAMLGYWGMETPWTEDGFFVTNDRGRIEPDRRLHVLGRLDQMILTGGENVAPEAVEEAALAFGGIAEARCRGESSPEWGTIVVLEVVPREPRRFERAPFEAHLRAQLPRFAVPKRIDLVSEIPRLPSGKMQRAPVP